MAGALWLAAMACLGLCCAVPAQLAATAAPTPPPPCPGELFPVSSIELLDAHGRVVFSTAAAAAAAAARTRKLCHAYPLAEENLGAKFQAAWRGFDVLGTVQFVLPRSAATGAAAMRVVGSAGPAGFVALYLGTETASADGAVTVPYPPAGGFAGTSPAHLSLFARGGKTPNAVTLAKQLMVGPRATPRLFPAHAATPHIVAPAHRWHTGLGRAGVCMCCSLPRPGV